MLKHDTTLYIFITGFWKKGNGNGTKKLLNSILGRKTQTIKITSLITKI